MYKKLLLALFYVTLVTTLAMANGHIDRMDKDKKSIRPDENSSYVNTNISNLNTRIIFESQKTGPDYIIGPEISTQMSGFYDYQTNGENKHQVNRFNSTTLHAIMMLSTDSTNVSATRRIGYSFSADDGATWSFNGPVPTDIRGGFGSLSVKTTGEAVVGDHYQPATYLTTGIHVDATPGLGIWTSTNLPPTFNFIWPGVARFGTTNNFLIAAEDYYGTAATDTGAVATFNGTLISNYKKIVTSDGASLTNMRWTYATGSNNNAIYVVDAISDVLGNLGLNRIFIFKTTNAGVTWDAGSVMYNPTIVGSDTLVPFFGLDAIYDNAGNYYVAFNTTDPQGSFASGKLWVSKNSGAPVLVAQHSGTNGIPDAANEVLHADAGICTIDHPALSVSADGSILFVAYSVQYGADTLNGYNKCHVYYSFSATSTLAFNAPIKVSNSGAGSFDERYPSLSQVSPDLGGANGTTLYLVYQKDSQPGSSAFNDGAPVTRATLIFRKITQANVFGIHQIGTEIPKTYSLNQNYPNPFNPTTRIRFELPKSGFVNMKLYDVNGREVATLINEDLSAGIKEYELNASNLASGVYMYKITAGDFSATKKLVLIK
jgi:hypothetical protein